MTKNIGARLEHCDGCDRVTKNVGVIRAGSEKGRSNVTVTKNAGAGQSRVRARSEQNMIHDKGAANQYNV